MSAATPSRGRILLATIVTIILVFAVWKFIDYRMQPPPPPPHAATPEVPRGR